jgi:hypothetical protein
LHTVATDSVSTARRPWQYSGHHFSGIKSNPKISSPEQKEEISAITVEACSRASCNNYFLKFNKSPTSLKPSQENVTVR